MNIEINCVVCEADLRGQGTPKACPRCKTPKPLLSRVFRHIKQATCVHKWNMGNLINYKQQFTCKLCEKVTSVNVEPKYEYEYEDRISRSYPSWNDFPEDNYEDEDDE